MSLAFSFSGSIDLSDSKESFNIDIKQLYYHSTYENCLPLFLIQLNMFSQKSDQKQFQSGVKQNYQNRNESLLPVSVRMIRNVQIQGDQVVFQGIPFTHVELLVRIDAVDNVKDSSKKLIKVSDDTGSLQITYTQTSESARDENIQRELQRLDNFSERYYSIILTIRQANNQIFYDLKTLAQVGDEEGNKILAHLTGICISYMRLKQKNPAIHQQETQNHTTQIPDVQVQKYIKSFLEQHKNNYPPHVSRNAIINEIKKRGVTQERIESLLEQMVDQTFILFTNNAYMLND